jgi:hypothetical protein
VLISRIGGVATRTRGTDAPGIRAGLEALRQRRALVLAHPSRPAKSAGQVAAWTLHLPAYGLMAASGSLWPALGATAAGLGQGSALVLLQAAAQEEIPDGVLGRVMGLVSLVHRGAHATGLLLVSSLFAFVDPQAVFAAAAVAIPAMALGGMALGPPAPPIPNPHPPTGWTEGSGPQGRVRADFRTPL